MIWYFEDYARLRIERQAIERLAASASWLSLGEWWIDESARLVAEATIAAAGREFNAIIRYPNHFPHSPVMVLPANETDRWSGHQWGAGGELCLEWGPDNWHPSVTGAMMLESAHRLLDGEATVEGERGLVPSRHQMSQGQDLRNEGIRFLITADLAPAVQRRPRGMFPGKYVLTWRHKDYVLHPLAVGGEEPPLRLHCPPDLSGEFVVRDFTVIRLDDSDARPDMASLETFNADLTRLGFAVSDDATYFLVSQGDQFFAYLAAKESNRVFRIAIVRADDGRPRLPEEFADLKNRKVAVIGCGSLGSKVAVSLARSGVGRFLLVDDDVLLPSNLVRHELNYIDLGHHKVDGVARRIRLASDAEVQVRRHMIGGQESSGSIETLIEGIAECDLILDCTSDSKAFNYLCAAVAVGKKPMISGEIFAGGIGGRMMRCRPGLDPDPASARAAVDAFCRDRGRVVGRGDIDYEHRNADGPPMIATDADVGIIAGHIARFACDLLVRGEATRYPASAYVIGFQEGWIFDAPFDTWPIDLGRPAPQEQAPSSLSTEEIAEETEMVRGLLLKVIENAS
jgi:hypothetical protein